MVAIGEPKMWGDFLAAHRGVRRAGLQRAEDVVYLRWRARVTDVKLPKWQDGGMRDGMRGT